MSLVAYLFLSILLKSDLKPFPGRWRRHGLLMFGPLSECSWPLMNSNSEVIVILNQFLRSYSNRYSPFINYFFRWVPGCFYSSRPVNFSVSSHG